MILILNKDDFTSREIKSETMDDIKQGLLQSYFLASLVVVKNETNLEYKIIKDRFSNKNVGTTIGYSDLAEYLVSHWNYVK